VSWLVSKMNYEVQVGKPIQVANAEGGADFSFENLMTVWMGFKPIGYKTSGTKYVRGKQVSEAATHEFIAMLSEFELLGREFITAFGIGFHGMGSLSPLKSDYFLFVQEGSTVKGRLFRILESQNVNEEGEYLSIVAEEIEERGTGWPV